MTVNELANTEGFVPVTLPQPERVIAGAYIGDLLSWVMGRAGADNAWITIMSNINVVAVASLADSACVILTEGVTLPDNVVSTACDKGVNIVSTKLPSYEAAVALSKLLQ